MKKSDSIYTCEIDGKLAISFGGDFIVHLSPDDALKLASDILKRLDVVLPN